MTIMPLKSHYCDVKNISFKFLSVIKVIFDVQSYTLCKFYLKLKGSRKDYSKEKIQIK